jgi:PKD repeat protein
VSAINDLGCAGASAIVQVEINPIPVAGFTALQLDEYTVQFTNTSTGADTYLWNFGFGDTSTELNPQYDFLFDNDWPVSLIATNTCGSDTLLDSVTVIKTGIDDILSKPITLIYSADGPVISGGFKSTEKVNLVLMNMSGQIVFNENYLLGNDFQIEPQTAELAAGIYLIGLKTLSGTVHFKWIK